MCVRADDDDVFQLNFACKVVLVYKNALQISVEISTDIIYMMLSPSSTSKESK